MSRPLRRKPEPPPHKSSTLPKSWASRRKRCARKSINSSRPFAPPDEVAAPARAGRKPLSRRDNRASPSFSMGDRDCHRRGENGKLGERAGASADKITERAKETAQAAAAMAQDAAGTIAGARDAAWETARKTSEQARNTARRATDQARDMADDLYRRGESQAQQIARRVEERPLAALLIAAAAGYALAYLLHSRR